MGQWLYNFSMQSLQALVALPYLAALMRSRRYPAWGIWLACWTPLVLTWHPDDLGWVRSWWLALVIPCTLFQALASIEAFFGAYRRIKVFVQVSIPLALFACCASIYVWDRPVNDAVTQVAEFALLARVGCAVFLVLSTAFLMSVGEWRWERRECRHLLMSALIVLTFAVPSLLSLSPWVYRSWHSADGIVSGIRAVLLVTWTIWIPDYPAFSRGRRAGNSSSPPPVPRDSQFASASAPRP